MSEIIQIRKKGGLGGIIRDASGVTIKPLLFNSKTNNPSEDGVLEGEYKGNTIINTKHFLAPHWDDNKWSFGGTGKDLAILLKQIGLRYPKNHHKAGLPIEVSADESARFGNRNDEVFTHKEFYGKYFMENGRINLDLSDPKQKFMYLCYKGNPTVIDSSDKMLNKYVIAGAKYEIVSPKKDTMDAKRSADKEMTAIGLLSAMNGDVSKLKSIAMLMTIPQYNPNSEPDTLFLLVKDAAAQNTTFSSKFGKTNQDKFIELASLPDSELYNMSLIMEAKSLGIIRLMKGHILFNGEKLDGVSGDEGAIKYFMNNDNQDRYVELLSVMEAQKKKK